MKATIKESIIAALLVVALFALLILVLDRIVMPLYTRHDQIVEVPDVVEMDLTEADTVLISRGFTLLVEDERYDEHYPVGTIIDQNPEAFSETKPGRRIYVAISSGEQMCVMPNLIGKSERDASFEAHSAGLTLSEDAVGYEYSFYYPQGVIMAQSIPPGTKLKKDTPIHVTSSLGNLPVEFRIPNLLGLTLDRAKKIILISGLALGEVTYQLREDLLPNTVLKQTPTPNQVAEKAQKVDLVASTLDREKVEQARTE